MSGSEVLACETEGCPVLESGRCLEGFENPADCPHSHTELPGMEADGANEPEPKPEPEEKTAEEAPTAAAAAVELGGGDSLTLNQSDLLANRHGARVILVAGAFQSGKTTLIAEIYGRFLKGPYCGWSFAGSDCLAALDSRYHGTRHNSGLMHPDVARTEDEEMRLVDMRLGGSRRISLMLSDLKGELFDNIAEGSAVEKEVPLAKRADLLVLLLDGKEIAADKKRDGMLSWSRQLVGGLTEEGGLRPGTHVAVVLSKADLVDDEHTSWFQERSESLVELAKERGCGPTEVFTVAARPDTSPHEPKALQPLFRWMTTELTKAISIPETKLSEERTFWAWKAQ